MLGKIKPLVVKEQVDRRTLSCAKVEIFILKVIHIAYPCQMGDSRFGRSYRKLGKVRENAQ